MRVKKPNKKKEQGAETKRKLYESAEKLFLKYDFSDISIEDITDEVGVTKGAFYVHFESKDALIAMLIADHAIRADMDYKTFLDSLPPDRTASEVLLALVEKIADVLVGTIGYENMKKVYQMMLAGTVEMDAVKGYGRELYMMFQSILEQGIQRGEFKTALPIDILSRHFVVAIRGISYEWCIRYPDFDFKNEAVAHFRILIDGIRSK